jgi:integrase
VPEPYRLGKHRGKFSLVYTDPERGRVRVALGTADKGLAESRARELWRARNAPGSDKVADLWPTYVADRLLEVARKDRFDSLWKALGPHFGHKLGKAITRQDCRNYHKARKRAGKSNSTVKTELEFLRACLRFHYKDAAPSIWLPPESKPRERYLRPDELDKLLENIEAPHVRLFVILAVTTGARMSALLDLTWDRVDLDVGTVDLNPAGREITNKRRTTVKLNQRATEALLEARAGALTDHVIEYGGKPVGSGKKAVRAAAERAGVPCSPHVFRHTSGVWMANRDVSMEKIAQRLGTTVRIAEKHYARFSPSYQKDAAEALDW